MILVLEKTVFIRENAYGSTSFPKRHISLGPRGNEKVEVQDKSSGIRKARERARWPSVTCLPLAHADGSSRAARRAHLSSADISPGDLRGGGSLQAGTGDTP